MIESCHEILAVIEYRVKTLRGKILQGFCGRMKCNTKKYALFVKKRESEGFKKLTHLTPPLSDNGRRIFSLLSLSKVFWYPAVGLEHMWVWVGIPDSGW